MAAISEIRFRASPHVELRHHGALSAEEREAFRELESDPEWFGLFVPKAPLTTSLKSVSNQAAELFQALATPSRVGAMAHELIDLVLDGILEIESDAGFVCGADALPLLASPLIAEAADGLSRDALLYAQDLQTSDADELASALYLYNRIPLSPFWQARFATPEAILAHLGAEQGALRLLLERHWTASRRRGWLCWSSRTHARSGVDAVTWKLYISPRPEPIRDAFEIVLRVLSAFPAMHVKIGDSAAGLLRPDKLVAYFTSRDALLETADALRGALAGCDAHGVPFSAPLDEAGVLSWGVDPPDNERALRWLRRDSWRSWLTQRLGAALSIAKCARSAAAVEPWQFAIERARRHGVDVVTWTPTAALWSLA
jgi:hypothetical protein